MSEQSKKRMNAEALPVNGDALQGAPLETHLQLYLQEKDKEGAKVYQEIKQMIRNKTVTEIEKLAVMDETVIKTALSS